MKINATADRMHSHDFQLGLVGFPLAHSISPQIHQAALNRLKLPGNYQLFPVYPDHDGQIELISMIAAIRQRNLHGLNVTIPHKQTMMSLVDELTPTASAIGAINTVYFQAGKVVGENTDAPAFLKDLDHQLGDFSPDQRCALILGAGGSARAVVFALASAGWTVYIAARRFEQAVRLQTEINVPSGEIHPIKYETNCFPQSFHLLVNTTPLGMHPKVNETPWSENWLPKECRVYDLVYNPATTRLVSEARQWGHRAVNGLGMLVEQAALAFEIWTGQTAPRSEMVQAASTALPHHNHQLREVS